MQLLTKKEKILISNTRTLTMFILFTHENTCDLSTFSRSMYYPIYHHCLFINYKRICISVFNLLYMCVIYTYHQFKPRLMHAIVDQDDDGGDNDQCK